MADADYRVNNVADSQPDGHYHCAATTDLLSPSFAANVQSYAVADDTDVIERQTTVVARDACVEPSIHVQADAKWELDYASQGQWHVMG